MSENLKSAIEQALHASPSRCRSYALEYSWQACTDQFLANLTTPVAQRPERVHAASVAHQIRPAA
jgi:hypothetical protein